MKSLSGTRPPPRMKMSGQPSLLKSPATPPACIGWPGVFGRTVCLKLRPDCTVTSVKVTFAAWTDMPPIASRKAVVNAAPGPERRLSLDAVRSIHIPPWIFAIGQRIRDVAEYDESRAPGNMNFETIRLMASPRTLYRVEGLPRRRRCSPAPSSGTGVGHVREYSREFD